MFTSIPQTVQCSISVSAELRDGLKHSVFSEAALSYAHFSIHVFLCSRHAFAVENVAPHLPHLNCPMFSSSFFVKDTA
jgi:hypothetical protein